MNWCAICGSQTHKWDSVGAHTEAEYHDYVQRVANEIKRERVAKMRAAYDLVAKDIKKKPTNMAKLLKRLGR